MGLYKTVNTYDLTLVTSQLMWDCTSLRTHTRETIKVPADLLLLHVVSVIYVSTANSFIRSQSLFQVLDTSFMAFSYDLQLSDVVN